MKEDTISSLVKSLSPIWFLLTAIASIIWGYALITARISTLESSDAKQDIRIEKQDATLQKIEVDVSYIRAMIEVAK
jgi:hypothetical protein